MITCKSVQHEKIALVLLLFSPLLAFGEFVIAERGQPADCSVDVRHKGSCTAVAAKDLIDYTEKLTGVRLAQGATAKRRIVLAEGTKDLGEDGFEIAVNGDELLIAGGRRGILYGVYDLLERFGDVAWLSSWCEDVPKADRFAVPDGFRFRDRPRMAVRDFHWSDPMRNPRFTARLRLNNASGLGVRTDLGVDALRFTSLGMTHTFARLLPPEKYFDAHPDWFSEVRGERLREKTQICLTNPGAVAQCIANVLESFRKTPDANAVAIVPNDYYNYCTCRSCKALDDAEGSQSGTVMNFVNTIAEAVEREFPGKWVVVEAYEYYRHPPKRLKLRDNVLVGVNAMEIDWRDPPRPDSPEGSGENVRDLMAWGKVSRHIYGWDFPCNCSWGMALHPNERKYQDWHRTWLANGCFALFSCGGGYHSDFVELKAYLSSRWLWNPDLSAERLTDRFFRGYYGAAASLVRQYYDARVRLADAANMKMRVYEQITTLDRVYSNDFLLESKRQLRQAEAMVKDDPVRRYNVRMTQMPIDYVLYKRLYKDIFFSKDDLSKAAAGRQAIADLMEGVRQAEAANHRAGLGMDVKLDKLRTDAAGTNVCFGANNRVVLEETAFEKNGYSRCHVDVDDPKAVNGRATRFDFEPQFQNQFTHLSLNRVQFAPGKKCRLTVRLRAEVPVPRGPLFQINVWKGGEQLVGKTFYPKDVTSEYADYVIGEWTPEPGQVVHFWITRYCGEGELMKPTPAKSVWIDNFTLEQLGPAASEGVGATLLKATEPFCIFKTLGDDFAHIQEGGLAVRILATALADASAGPAAQLKVNGKACIPGRAEAKGRYTFEIPASFCVRGENRFDLSFALPSEKTFLVRDFALEIRHAKSFRVVESAKPEIWERFAAEQLKDYLLQLVGDGTLTVGGVTEPVFHVGDGDLAKAKQLGSSDLREEEWVIRQFGRDIVLNGGGTRGCLYAVWHFLEDFCGVRFWSDTEEDVPGPSDLTLARLDVRGKPHFDYRDVYRTEQWGGAKSLTAARRRLNRNGNTSTPLMIGGAYEYGAPYFCHTHDLYLPFKKFGKDHPEWYALRDGQRVGGQREGQLCLTNPEVLEKMKELVLENIRKGDAQAAARGEAAPRMYDLTHNDNQNYCQCPRCMEAEKKYGRSGIMLNFVNPIAAAVAKVRPEIKIHVCAYEFTEAVPKGDVHAAPNVIVDLNNTTGNKVQPISDKSNSFFRNELMKWHAHTDQLAVSDFSITYNKGTLDFPFANEWLYEELIRLFATNGVTTVFMQHDRPETADLQEIKYYVESRLLEDPKLDGDALVETAIREYYGAAAGAHVLAVRRRLRDNERKYKSNVTWFPNFYEFCNSIRDEDVEFFRHELDAAETAAKGDARILRRLKKSRIGWDKFFDRYARTQVRTDEGWVTPAVEFAVGRKKYGELVDDATVTGGKVVRVNRSEKKFAMPVGFGSYDILNEADSPLGGHIPTIVEDGKYHWVKLGETTHTQRGWMLWFGADYTTVTMNYRPMSVFKDKRIEVSLEIKADQEHFYLSLLRFRPVEAPRPEELVEYPVSMRVRGHERTEWSTDYGYDLDYAHRNVPRVLLIGDSITCGYLGGVRKLLEGKMTVSYWSSSYCVTCACYLKRLAIMLDEADYSVIHLNNGAHSLYTKRFEDWEVGLESVLRLIRARQPKAKIVWTSSTPVKDPKQNAKLEKFNAIARKVIAKYGDIATDDLHALMEPLDRERYWADNCHFKPAAIKMQAQQVADACLKAAGLTGKSETDSLRKVDSYPY